MEGGKGKEEGWGEDGGKRGRMGREDDGEGRVERGKGERKERRVERRGSERCGRRNAVNRLLHSEESETVLWLERRPGCTAMMWGRG